jgi:hypothetical protein
MGEAEGQWACAEENSLLSQYLTHLHRNYINPFMRVEPTWSHLKSPPPLNALAIKSQRVLVGTNHIAIFSFLVGLGFELRALCLQSRGSTICTSNPFCSDYFEDGVLWTLCLGWPWTMILLISASQVAKIYRHEPPVPGWQTQLKP